MRKRTLVTLAVVGMAVLVMGVSISNSLASDGNSAKGDAPSPSATAPNAAADDQIAALKQQMALQQKQLELMQKALAEQKELLEKLQKSDSKQEQAAKSAPAAQPAERAATAQQPGAASPAKPLSTASASPAIPAALPVSTGQGGPSEAATLGQVASTSPIIPRTYDKSQEAIAPIGAGQKIMADTETSPLQFHIGSATFIPIGFMDFTSVFRTKTAGGNIGTSFGSIPYNAIASNGTTPYQTNLTELRLSMQNSRIGFRADADVHGAHVMGYFEADFLGTPASLNIAVTNNANLLRSRLYWVDIRRGAWEVLGGQTWSLLTPGRSGISPLPADIFYSQDIDVNYQAGLFWGRIPELRFVYHPNKQVAFALAIDSPDQYAGGSSGGGAITLPTALATPYAGELDFAASSGGIATPNVAPDVIAKLAVDPNKMVHFEIGGVERNFKVYNPNTSSNYTAEGGGGFVNLHVEPVKGFRLLTNNFWSDGGGRYIFGQSPDLIATATGNLSLVHSGSTVTGFEATHKKSMVYGYYGGIYIMRNIAIDTTGKPVGYGYSGSSTGQNRTIQELTIGFNQTIWKDAKWGAVNFMGQYSYLLRDPWYIAPGQPNYADNHMLFFNLRYTLPGSAPTLGSFAR